VTSVWLAIGLGITLGTLIGVGNGLIITKLQISPLIATLGTLVALRGATHLYYTHLYAHEVVSRLPRDIVFLGQGFVGPVPVPAIIAAAVCLFAWYLFHYTRFGSDTTSIGSNESAPARSCTSSPPWCSAGPPCSAASARSGGRCSAS
jgi:ribose/xylose/arabinose/galactoside ABC-type transport system permease subunit